MRKEDRLAQFAGLGLERWQVPLRLEQVRTTITSPPALPAAAASHGPAAGADLHPAASSAMPQGKEGGSKALPAQPQLPAGASAASMAVCAATAGELAGPLPGRWCSEEGRWVDLAWDKCPNATHCVQPQGHACFCIVTMSGAQTYLSRGA